MRASSLGSTHGALRWNTVSDAASGCIAGTNCMAEAPVPITATRLPRRSTPWSQCAEWKRSPLNVSSPGNAGVTGSCIGPVATMMKRAV